MVDETSKAVRLQALITGGLRVLEVTLRTDNALAVIKEMVNNNAEGIIGAGTILSENDVYAAKNAGAKFGVSPGTTEQILRACAEVNLPLLPGAATVSNEFTIKRLFGTKILSCRVKWWRKSSKVDPRPNAWR